MAKSDFIGVELTIGSFKLDLVGKLMVLLDRLKNLNLRQEGSTKNFISLVQL